MSGSSGLFDVTCVLCPRGCSVRIRKDGENLTVVDTGCKRGAEYALKELVDPQRTLATTVKTVFGDFPRLPVRTAGMIPLDHFFRFMKVINDIEVSSRKRPGDIVKSDILGTGIDIIATDDMTVNEGRKKNV